MDPNEVSIQKIVDARVTIADRQYDLVLEPDEAAAMCKDQWYLYCKQAEEQKEAKKSLERLAIEDERASDLRRFKAQLRHDLQTCLKHLAPYL